MLLATIFVLAVLRLTASQLDPADAAQPYAPRGISAATVPSGDWFAVAVRASGFRPNTAVLVGVDGLEQRTIVADAAGVVDLSVPLPTRIGVEVRGAALEGGELAFRQDVPLVGTDTTRRSLVVALLVVLSGALGAVLVPRLQRILGARRRTDAVATAPPDAAR